MFQVYNIKEHGLFYISYSYNHDNHIAILDLFDQFYRHISTHPVQDLYYSHIYPLYQVDAVLQFLYLAPEQF